MVVLDIPKSFSLGHVFTSSVNAGPCLSHIRKRSSESPAPDSQQLMCLRVLQICPSRKPADLSDKPSHQQGCHRDRRELQVVKTSAAVSFLLQSTLIPSRVFQSRFFSFSSTIAEVCSLYLNLHTFSRTAFLLSLLLLKWVDREKFVEWAFCRQRC